MDCTKQLTSEAWTVYSSLLLQAEALCLLYKSPFPQEHLNLLESMEELPPDLSDQIKNIFTRVSEGAPKDTSQLTQKSNQLQSLITLEDLFFHFIVAAISKLTAPKLHPLFLLGNRIISFFFFSF